MYDISQTVPAAFCRFLDGLSSGAAALFERSVTQPAKASAALKQTHPSALEVFRDTYRVKFLELPGAHAETDLHQGLLTADAGAYS